MRYVMSLSGGVASAVAAERAIARHGREAVTLWFADTGWEDEDLHRFLADCLARWGGALVTVTEGRTPLEVAEDEHVFPTQRLAPCSSRLKVRPFRRWLADQPRPLTVLLGLDWRERHRMAGPRAAYATDGLAVDFPLDWRPLEYRPYVEVVAGWGIAPPRLYALGFPHNNCGGRCVRQGIAEWQRLKRHFPERFAEVRDWEAAQRAKGAPWSGRAFARDRSGGEVRPRTLAEIERMAEPPEGQLTMDDQFACFCQDA